MTEGVSVSLYRYTGTPGRIWPDVPTTPEPGDVVDWRDLTPDPNAWEPAPKAKTVRPADNDTPEAPELVAPLTTEPADAAETQE